MGRSLHCRICGCEQEGPTDARRSGTANSTRNRSGRSPARKSRKTRERESGLYECPWNRSLRNLPAEFPVLAAHGTPEAAQRKKIRIMQQDMKKRGGRRRCSDIIRCGPQGQRRGNRRSSFPGHPSAGSGFRIPGSGLPGSCQASPSGARQICSRRALPGDGGTFSGQIRAESGGPFH